jgi:ABC-type nitrate/sulfonate/bicarbonate transport system permease component
LSVSLLFSLLGISNYLRMAFKPVLSFFISIPTITWVPVLLILTGISETTIIIAIFLGSFFTIVYSTLEGFENVDPNLHRVGIILGFTRVQSLIRISIPASFNSIMVGLKLGIAYSWRALVGAEMLGAVQIGLGYLVFASRKFYDIRLMIVSLVSIGLIGYLLNTTVIKYLERKTLNKWGIQ